MAGLNFLNFMLAKVLARNLVTAVQEQAAKKEILPSNVFIIPKELDAWTQIKEACRKENMVFLMDFTHRTRENCKRVDNNFFDLAREFELLPFFLVQVGFEFGTFDQVSSYSMS